jgi:hypothetical protein
MVHCYAAVEGCDFAEVMELYTPPRWRWKLIGRYVEEEVVVEVADRCGMNALDEVELAGMLGRRQLGRWPGVSLHHHTADIVDTVETVVVVV